MKETEILNMREEKISQFIESKMIDSDGLVYSAINELTQKPFTDDELPKEICFKTVDAPEYLWQSAFFNYEDSLMATSEFLRANIYKYQITGDEHIRQLAQTLFQGLKSTALASSKYSGNIVKSMFGFLSKPYGGVKTAHLSGEVSIDQYQRVMVALELYRDTLASDDEKQWIKKFLVACSDCWDINNYTFNYMQGICRWGCCQAHSVAFALYCSAVGMSLSGKEQHKGWFDVFMSRTDVFENMPDFSYSDNVAALVALSCHGLCSSVPEEKSRWSNYAERIYESALGGMDEDGYGWLFTFLSGQKKGELLEPHWENEGGRYWDFLRWRGNIRRPLSALAGAAVDVFELTENSKYLEFAQTQLQRLGTDGYLLHLEPLTSADMPEGYEPFSHSICGLNSAVWLRTYWQLRIHS